MWIAYSGSTETDIIDIVDNILIIMILLSTKWKIEIQPIEEPDMEVSYEIVEMEMEMPVVEIEDARDGDGDARDRSCQRRDRD